MREMVDKLQEERVSAATQAESAKRRTGEVEQNFDLLETEKLGLEWSVFSPLLSCRMHSVLYVFTL